MYCAAQREGFQNYNTTCYMVRAKAFKAYKEGRWQIHSLYENNNWKVDWGKEYCWYCGKHIDDCGKLTAEHIFPRAKGGDDNFDNIAYACKNCNSSKSDKDLIKWLWDDMELIPPFPLVCIYMKLVYKYATEHNLMSLNTAELNDHTLPFDYRSLLCIEYLIKEVYISPDE